MELLRINPNSRIVKGIFYAYHYRTPIVLALAAIGWGLYLFR